MTLRPKPKNYNIYICTPVRVATFCVLEYIKKEQLKRVRWESFCGTEESVWLQQREQGVA